MHLDSFLKRLAGKNVSEMTHFVSSGHKKINSVNQSTVVQVRSPRTNMELVMTILLAIASMILAVNGLLTLYKCMCSRNYARWRSSWQRKRRVRRRHDADYYTEFRETVPLIMAGHRQVLLITHCELWYCVLTHTHTHTRLMALCPGLPR